MRGIAGRMSPDLLRAENYLRAAATTYRDPQAQFELGRLYDNLRDGQAKRRAARWFALAARSSHSQAQTRLGLMLLRGEGVSRAPLRGVLLLARAVHGAEGEGTRESARAAFRAGMSALDRPQRRAALGALRLHVPEALALAE